VNLILHVSHPDIDLGFIGGAGPMPTWLSAITPFLDFQSDIRDGSMTLLGRLKDLPALTQLLKRFCRNKPSLVTRAEADDEMTGMIEAPRSAIISSMWRRLSG